MPEYVLYIFIFAAKPAVVILVVTTLGWIGFRLSTGRSADWPINIATLSIPISATLILWTARPTQRSDVLGSNFLALESGWSLVASFVFVWSFAWLVLQKRRRPRPASWKLVLAVGAGFVSVLVMFSLLPLTGRPEL